MTGANAVLVYDIVVSKLWPTNYYVSNTAGVVSYAGPPGVRHTACAERGVRAHAIYDLQRKLNGILHCSRLSP